MGGPGSTRWRDRRKAPLVEETLALDLPALRRAGLFEQPPETAFHLNWTRDSGNVVGVGTAELQRDSAGRERLELDLRTATSGRPKTLEVAVRLVQRALRTCLVCPGCQGAVEKIYIPWGSDRIGCRRCLGLQYRSVQTHDARLDHARRDPVGFLNSRAHLRSPRSGLVTARLAHRALALSVGARRGRGWGAKSMTSWKRAVAEIPAPTGRQMEGA